MIIRNVCTTLTADGNPRLSARVTYETPAPRTFEVYFELQGAPGEMISRADPFLIGFLLPAMLLGENLRIEADVDPKLLTAIHEKVVPLMKRWAPYLSEITVECGTESLILARPDERRGLLAFSGGLDACYTAVKRLERIDGLLLSWGFDVRSHQTELWKQTLPAIRNVAEALERPLYVLRTNLREVSHYQAIRMRRGRIDPRYYSLGRSGPNGPYLAAIGRCLAPFASEFWIGASNTYELLYPFGTHPLFDPMWSTPEQEVFHDGCEAGRLEKIAFLKDRHPSLLGTLRVCCWLPRPGEINCGRCEKCLRTMAEIRLSGAEHLATTFNWPLDLEAIRRQKVPRQAPRKYWLLLHERARQEGDAELERAIRRLLRPGLDFGRIASALPGRRSEQRLAREHWKFVRRVLKPPDDASGEMPDDEPEGKTISGGAQASS